MNSPTLPQISSGDKVRVTNPKSEWFGGSGEVYKVDDRKVWVRVLYRGRFTSIGFPRSSLEKAR